MVYEENLFNKAKELISLGVSVRKTASIIGIKRETLIYWLTPNCKISNKLQPLSFKPNIIDVLSSDDLYNQLNLRIPREEFFYHYSYILGLYLGDGNIVKFPRSYRLTISLGITHQDVIRRCFYSLSKVFERNKVNIINEKKAKVVRVIVYTKSLLALFPQHGPGKKHTRKIELASWQKEIIDLYPEAFIKGLIDSDGSYYIPKATGAPVYNFSNKSEDIKILLKHYCDILGIHYTIPSKKHIGFTRRDCVTKLDAIYNDGHCSLEANKDLPIK